MVKDNTNTYFSDLIDYLTPLYTGVDGSQTKTDTPPSFPYVYFNQLGGSTELTTLSGTEDGVRVTYEIRAYQNGKLATNKVRNIANSIREYMIGCGFRCTYFKPEENLADTNVKQFISRYEKLDT